MQHGAHSSNAICIVVGFNFFVVVVAVLLVFLYCLLKTHSEEERNLKNQVS